MEMLTSSSLSLSQLGDELPATHVARIQVKCPWEHKGRIMRELTREADALVQAETARIELVDGIKVFREDGWVLVLPDSSEPLFHVYAEAGSDDEAQRLIGLYIERIEQLRG